MIQRNTCRSGSTVDSFRKIQNRESARRVRLREKDGAHTLHSKFMELQETTQRLQIENTALRSENLMLRNQVEFMEKLLLQRTGCGSQHQGDESQLKRVDSKGGFGRNVGMIALVCMVLVATYLPEQDSGLNSDASVQQRILAEIGTGFHILNSKSLAGFVLSLFRVASFIGLLVYTIYTGAMAYKRVTKKSSEDILQSLLNKKNN